MEELLREIIAPSPSSPTTSLPFEIFSPDLQVTNIPSASPFSTVMSGALDEEDLQRLLSMIPDVQHEQEQIEFSPSLDLPLSGWDLTASVFWYTSLFLFPPSSLSIYFSSSVFYYFPVGYVVGYGDFESSNVRRSPVNLWSESGLVRSGFAPVLMQHLFLLSFRISPQLGLMNCVFAVGLESARYDL
jgi:hypothetical protein